MTKLAVKPFGRCPRCQYKLSSVNHRVLCMRRVPAPRSAAEIARLTALATWGDTAAEQWQRREALR